MFKNVASQKIGAQLINAADGAAFTGSVTCYVTGDAGTQAVGSVGAGACVHEGNGYHTYAPAQAETNYDLIAFTFIGTGAVPKTEQVFTDAVTPTVDVTKWDGDAVAAADDAGVPVVNIKYINGDATDGNNATLSLKKLDINNSAGLAVELESGDGTAVLVTAGGAGDGMHAVSLVGHGSNGNGLNAIGSGNGSGIYAAGGLSGISGIGYGTGAGLLLSGGAAGGGTVGGAAHGAGDGPAADWRSLGTGPGLLVWGSTTTATGYGVTVVAKVDNSHAVNFAGQGTGHGLLATGGATGDGIRGSGGATNGHGLRALGVGTGVGIYATGGATGPGMQISGGATSGLGLTVTTTDGHAVSIVAGGAAGRGVHIAGSGSGVGFRSIGGATGAGMSVIGGATSGPGFSASATSGDGIIATATSLGHGMSLTGAGSNKHGLIATGSNTDVGDGIKAVGGSGGIAARGFLDEVVEGSYTLKELHRLIGAVLLGEASGLSGTTAEFRDAADTKVRVTATVDEFGNRSAIVLDAT